MNSLISIIYDDRISIPRELNEIVGAHKFSHILRKRISLGNELVNIVRKVRPIEFHHLLQDSDAFHLKNSLRNDDLQKYFIRLPSCLIIKEKTKLENLIKQSRFFEESAFVGEPSNGEAILLLRNSEIYPFLDAYDPEIITENIESMIGKLPRISDIGDIVDIRNVENFLTFMSEATEARSINQVEYSKWTVCKKSKNKNKIEAEYNYFHIAPDIIKQFLVPTFGYKEEAELASYSMERISIPDVAIQYIHNSFNDRSFSLLLDRFFGFINLRPQKKCSIHEVYRVGQENFIKKLRERTELASITEFGSKANKIISSLSKYQSLDELVEHSIQIASKFLYSEKIEYLSFSHGDPCFSNILFDRQTGIFRLIDPKGALTEEEAWMHPYYDIAKFSHSVMGGYDFINNELFDCIINDDLELSLVFQDGGSPNWCKQMWMKQLENNGLHNNTIRACELTLFLSMLPYHMDFPRKNVGYLLNSIGIIQELEVAR